jgi:hypothetical protein
LFLLPEAFTAQRLAQMKYYYPHGYNGSTSTLTALGGVTPSTLIKDKLPALYKECETWAKVVDENLEFKVKIADATLWGNDKERWEGLWVADNDVGGELDGDDGGATGGRSDSEEY